MFRLFFAGIKKVKSLVITLLFLAISSYSVIAQPLQKIYSGLDQATSLFVTQNTVYVVEQGQNKLLKFDHTGKQIEAIGGKGSGDYQFSKPVDVDATNGLKIFVTDFNNRRVQVFDRRGQYLSSISGRNYFGVNQRYNPAQLAVSDMGEVYFVDENSRYLHHFDLDFNLLDEFRIPVEIESVDEIAINSAEIFILDRSSQTIHRLALNGSYRGFYPAEGVKAMFANEAGIWTSYARKAVLEPESGEALTLQFGTEVEPVDMHFQNKSLFILTKDALLKMAVPER